MGQTRINEIINNDNITVEQLKWGIAHSKQIVDQEHTTKEALVDDDFDFAKSLELEGFFAVPNDAELVFDCGEHDNRGLLLPNTSPLDDKDIFEQNLLNDLYFAYITKSAYNRKETK